MKTLLLNDHTDSENIKDQNKHGRMHFNPFASLKSSLKVNCVEGTISYNAELVYIKIISFIFFSNYKD